MADIIDLPLVAAAGRILRKLLRRRGIAYFLQRDGPRLMAIDAAKVDLVVRTAASSRARQSQRPAEEAVGDCRRRVRRELIRLVTRAMIEMGY